MRSPLRIGVIGGGPAGSTAAALLAGHGIAVTLFERAVFPRYHIGESMITSVVSIADVLGLREKIEARGFVRKYGVLFDWGVEDWSIEFRNNPTGPAYSWQVERAEFDHLLLEHAAEAGAKVVQNATVKSVVLDDGGRARGIRWIDNDRPATVNDEEFDVVIDASGRSGVLSAQQLRNRRHHEVFQNVAVWGYWKGASTLPDGPAGAINVVAVENGWYWAIPLRETLSLGLVTSKENFRRLRPAYASVDDLYLDQVRSSDVIRSMITGAELTSAARVEQDYSYAAEAFRGPGYYLAGDAACFLDPLLSTGVHLAMYSGALSAACVAAVADGTVTEDQAARFYEASYRRAYVRIFIVVSSVYHQYRGRDHYFWQAQRLVHDASQYADIDGAFIDIVSGMRDLKEATAPDRSLVTELLSEELRRSPEAAFGTDALDGAPIGRPGFDHELLQTTSLSEADSVGGLYVTLAPRLGLRRRGSETGV